MVKPDFAGTTGGGQVGYNIQFGKTVVGIEGEYGVANARGGFSCPNMNFFTCEADTNRMAMLTGRLGLTWGRALILREGWSRWWRSYGGDQTKYADQSIRSNPLYPAVVDNQLATRLDRRRRCRIRTNGSLVCESRIYALRLRSGRVHDLHGRSWYACRPTGDTVRIGLNMHLHPVQREMPLK